VTSKPGTAPARVVVNPIDAETEKALAIDHWMARRRAMTEKLSGGRLGYLYLSEMNQENYQRAVDYTFGEGRDKEGLVIDIRYNGGGNLHDQLVTLFTGKSRPTSMRGMATTPAASRRTAGANPAS
jgi:tricorn protease